MRWSPTGVRAAGWLVVVVVWLSRCWGVGVGCARRVGGLCRMVVGVVGGVWGSVFGGGGRLGDGDVGGAVGVMGFFCFGGLVRGWGCRVWRVVVGVVGGVGGAVPVVVGVFGWCWWCW